MNSLQDLFCFQVEVGMSYGSSEQPLPTIPELKEEEKVPQSTAKAAENPPVTVVVPPKIDPPKPKVYSLADAIRILSDIDGCEDYVDALRGQYSSTETYDILVEALRDTMVPDYLKNDRGPIRTAIGEARLAQKLAEGNQKLIEEWGEIALQGFHEFREELEGLSSLKPGRETQDLIRSTSNVFFDHEVGNPPLIKVIQTLMGMEGNPVNDLLACDRDLAEVVANVAHGRRATALIEELKHRAVTATWEKKNQPMRKGKTERDKAKKALRVG